MANDSANPGKKTPGFLLRALCSALASLLIGGCAATKAPQGLPAETYACDEGRMFSVAYTPENHAVIDIAGMQFRLDPQASSADGQTYGCSVLTLWRNGKSAWVTMDQEGSLQNCRRLQ